MIMYNRLRNLVVGFFGKIGYRIMRNDRVPKTDICLLGLLVDAVFQNQDITLLQIGANDGDVRDPVSDLIRKKANLKGVLLEPLPHAFERLKITYEGVSNVTFLNAAITDHNGEVDLYLPREGVSDLDDQIASLDKGHLRRLGIKDSEIKSQKVRGITIKSCLSECGLDRVDVLVVDTEGYDFVVLNEVLVGLSLRPSVIQFENCNLTPKDKEKSRLILDKSGYVIFETLYDTIAVRRPSCA